MERVKNLLNLLNNQNIFKKILSINNDSLNHEKISEFIRENDPISGPDFTYSCRIPIIR